RSSPHHHSLPPQSAPALPPRPTLSPYTTLFRSLRVLAHDLGRAPVHEPARHHDHDHEVVELAYEGDEVGDQDRRPRDRYRGGASWEENTSELQRPDPTLWRLPLGQENDVPSTQR